MIVSQINYALEGKTLVKTTCALLQKDERLSNADIYFTKQNWQ